MKNKTAKSFVTIMVVIAICALFLRVIIERIIRINITQHESYASVTLKFVSAALENYAKDNQGVYPTSLSFLTNAKPPYLDKDYISESPLRGYNYSCPRLEPAGYVCYANPTKCKLTGETVYTVTTGSLLLTEGCETKE